MPERSPYRNPGRNCRAAFVANPDFAFPFTGLLDFCRNALVEIEVMAFGIQDFCLPPDDIISAVPRKLKEFMKNL